MKVENAIMQAFEELLDDADGAVTEEVAVRRAIALARASKYPSPDDRPAPDPLAHALDRAVCRIRQDRARRDREDLERRQSERAAHERAVLLAPRETLESVVLKIAETLDAPSWDSSTMGDVYQHLHSAGFAPPAGPNIEDPDTIDETGDAVRGAR